MVLKKRTYTIRLWPADVERIKTAAEKMGTGHTTLSGIWILERLEQCLQADGGDAV